MMDNDNQIVVRLQQNVLFQKSYVIDDITN